DLLFAGHLEALPLHPAFFHEAVIERPPGGHIADQDEVHQHAVEVAPAQLHRAGSIGPHVTAPAGLAALPVVFRGDRLALDEHRGQAAGAALAVHAADRTPLAVVDLEYGVLFQFGAHPA